MPGCVLRVYGCESGDDFDVDAFLASSMFSPCSVSYRSKRRHAHSDKPTRASGFNLVVSEADGDHVPAQIEDAVAFLNAHCDEIRRLMKFSGVATIYLDFGWDFPYDRVPGQYNCFPLTLLSACAELGIEIVVSVYGCLGQREAPPQE